MSSFEDRKKNFENKFAHDEELKFKVNSKRNKYLGEWAAEILGKKDQEKEQYILEVIKSDFSEPGDEDIIKKLYQDLKDKNISENDVREKLNELLQTAKKDFLQFNYFFFLISKPIHSLEVEGFAKVIDGDTIIIDKKKNPIIRNRCT